MVSKLTSIALFVCAIIYSEITHAQSNLFPASGRTGIGTTSPFTPLDVRTNESAGIPVASFGNTFANYSREVEDNRPFAIKRNVNNGEAVYTFIQDTEAIYEYRNDEASNRMVFRLVNTDTETGGGVNANRNEVMILHGNGLGGGVSVGSGNLPFGYRLSVDGKIIAEELQIKQSTTWPDFVFEDDYQLRSLSEVKEFIDENKHLPDIPSEKQVKEEGISVGEMNAKLLQKIEELTLYLLEQNQRLDAQESKIKELTQQINQLQNK
nr:hypothetical protein [uncultured Marinifilum sp.]